MKGMALKIHNKVKQKKKKEENREIV